MSYGSDIQARFIAIDAIRKDYWWVNKAEHRKMPHERKSRWKIQDSDLILACTWSCGYHLTCSGVSVLTLGNNGLQSVQLLARSEPVLGEMGKVGWRWQLWSHHLPFEYTTIPEKYGPVRRRKRTSGIKYSEGYTKSYFLGFTMICVASTEVRKVLWNLNDLIRGMLLNISPSCPLGPVLTGSAEAYFVQA